MNKTNSNLNFINLTGHYLTILDEHGERILTLASDGRKAWLKNTYVARNGPEAWLASQYPAIPNHYVVNAVEIATGEDYQQRSPFPPEEAGTVYICAAAVCAFLREDEGRTDVYSPGKLYRRADGSIQGCLGLAY